MFDQHFTSVNGSASIADYGFEKERQKGGSFVLLMTFLYPDETTMTLDWSILMSIFTMFMNTLTCLL